MTDEAKPVRRFGPMHGEKTQRHQFVSQGGRGGTIVSLVEVDSGGPRLNVELMRQGPMGGLVSADLTAEEVAWLRAACDEFLAAYPEMEVVFVCSGCGNTQRHSEQNDVYGCHRCGDEIREVEIPRAEAPRALCETGGAA